MTAKALLRTKRFLLLPLGMYLSLWAVAAIYAWYKGSFDPAHSEFAGMPLIILGLPWTFIWHNFNPRIIESEYNNSIVVTSMFAFLNAILIFVVTLIIFVMCSRSR